MSVFFQMLINESALLLHYYYKITKKLRKFDGFYKSDLNFFEKSVDVKYKYYTLLAKWMKNEATTWKRLLFPDFHVKNLLKMSIQNTVDDGKMNLLSVKFYGKFRSEWALSYWLSLFSLSFAIIL